jgi:hypothetical protein
VRTSVSIEWVEWLMGYRAEHTDSHGHTSLSCFIIILRFDRCHGVSSRSP